MFVKELSSQTFSANAYGPPGDKFSDTSALGFSWRPGGDPIAYNINKCLIDGSGCSEGLKLSFCHNVNVSQTRIIGGREDCVDIVRGGDIVFDDCEFISLGTRQHVTIKGGARSVSFVNCRFINSYSCWWDGACIDLGNWTDYDDAPRPYVKNITIENCSMLNVRRGLLARVLYSERPKIINSPGKVFKVPSLAVALFWLGQRKGILGRRRRFPAEWLKVYDIEL
jgi:hypothetical protein